MEWGTVLLLIGGFLLLVGGSIGAVYILRLVVAALEKYNREVK